MEQPQDGINSKTYWRKVDKIIIHNKFINEARSWKGYDFALIKGDGYNEAMYDEEDASTISLLLTSNFILLVFFSTYISEFK